MASDSLGGRIWGPPIPLNRGRWATFDFSHDPKNRFLLWFFDTPNSTYQQTALEAAELEIVDVRLFSTLEYCLLWNVHVIKDCYCSIFFKSLWVVLLTLWVNSSTAGRLNSFGNLLSINYAELIFHRIRWKLFSTELRWIFNKNKWNPVFNRVTVGYLTFYCAFLVFASMN